MKSMTGYARVEGRIDKRFCSVEIKTVNHRFLDIYLKVPKGFSLLELPIKKYLGGSITRGRVDVTIQMGNGEDNGCRVKLNLGLAQQYFGLLTQLKEELQLAEAISLKHLSSLPDVFVVEKVEEDFTQWEELRALLERAVDALNTMRETEGAALQQDLQQRAANITRIVSEIETYAAQVTTANREKLLKRFRSLDAPFSLDEPRLLTEVFFLAERADITEEIVRVKSHLTQYQELLQSPNAVGRKLDFTLQEINREVNTIGAKANDVRVSQAVVEIKGDLEKMREQVQNVE